MNLAWIKIIVPVLYLLVAGFMFASELYKRIYDRGNSEIAGLGTYLLTMPSSSLIDWISVNLFGVEKIGGSDTSFTIILGLSVVINTVLLFLAVLLLFAIARRVSEI